jgi:hypothetical protein
MPTASLPPICLLCTTIGFKLLYGLVILSHRRRRLIHYAVTAHPTSEWVARQIVEAFPWDETPPISCETVTASMVPS